jgi:hypothetical protein
MCLHGPGYGAGAGSRAKSTKPKSKYEDERERMRVAQYSALKGCYGEQNLIRLEMVSILNTVLL